MSLLSSAINHVRCLADEENDHNMLQGKFNIFVLEFLGD